MMKHTILAALIFASVPAVALAASPTVEVANGNWSYLPPLEKRGNDNMSGVAISRIHEIATAGTCERIALRGRILEFDMTFAAEFAPNGALERVVMPRLNCPEAEAILGGVLVKMIQNGDYRPDGSNDEGWYRGALSFTFR